MSDRQYDLVIIGAGSGGLTAASFAARLGAKVALVEKHRVGGDCTWTGCVPSKALLKAAKVAHEIRNAARFGIATSPPVADMARVRDYVRSAITQVYQMETPEELRSQGIDVIVGGARFLDAHTIEAGGQRIASKFFLIATGARPFLPPIKGLAETPYVTYEQIFDNDQLPGKLLVVGGGPIGLEMAQAYQRLGAQVTVVAEEILPKDEAEVRDVIRRVLAREGIQFVSAKANAAKANGVGVTVTAGGAELSGDLLLVAAGRKPTVEGLALENAGVTFSERGIAVDSELRTNVKHIYAAGDVTGGYQFTHFAGWQAFQAARNALLPGSASGLTDLVPWVTFTDPEVAHIGMTESQARERFVDAIEVRRQSMAETDRAVCENDTEGLLKMIFKKDGTLVGATMVASRAGEAITELVLAIKQGAKAADLSSAIHPYPTYSTAIQQVAAKFATEAALTSTTGRLATTISRFLR